MSHAVVCKTQQQSDLSFSLGRSLGLFLNAWNLVAGAVRPESVAVLYRIRQAQADYESTVWS